MNPRIAIDAKSILPNSCNSKKLRPVFAYLVLFCSLVPITSLFCQTTQTFSSSATWTCPAGVTLITVECWGGGGAGGGVNSNGNHAGAGGGGGAYKIATSVSVIPGSNYFVTVGKGGMGDLNGLDGGDGGNSYFNINTALANGGKGGGDNEGAAGAGGIGGTYGGGNGASAVDNKNSGGGGGGAGSSAKGGDASQLMAGLGGSGNINGNGGDGLSSRLAGNSGKNIGGGGGGARGRNETFAGGNGGDGQVAISYVLGNNFIDYTNGAHGTVCNKTNEANPGPSPYAVFTAPAGTVFTTVTFASYGTPIGNCDAFQLGSCHSSNSQVLAEGLLLGNGGTVNISPSNGQFTDPCVGTLKQLYVQVTYTQPICYNTSTTITGTILTGSPTYSWEQSTTNSSTGFTTVGGNTINYSTGNLTQTTWFRRKVTSGGISSYSPVLQISVLPTPVPTAVTTPTCVGGSSGTITASASGGATPFTYSLNAGTYQSGVTFSGLTAGTYTLAAKSSVGCIGSTSVVLNPYPNSTDDQTAAGANSWVGHIYSGMNFNNYIGHFTEAETFDEGFGGDYNCFTVSSGATYPSIYTEQFSVRFRMNSSRDGLYVADLGSDDGSRLYVDGTLIYNNWADQGFSTRSSVLMNLTGSSSLVYEFYENGGANRVIFNNGKLILANNLSSNITQSICTGSTGAAISGDIFGTLPAGISLSGTGYQWSYSTTPAGTRTNIAGATSAIYSPNTSIAPFNVAGTYYIYRNAKVSSANNTGVGSYSATNESNASIITVTAPVGTPVFALGSTSARCQGAGSVTYTATATNAGSITYSLDAASIAGGNSINSSTGTVTYSAAWSGTSTVTASASGCGGPATSTYTVTTGAPPSVSATSTYTCVGGSSGTITAIGSGGSTPYTYSLNGGTYQSSNLFAGLAAGTYTLSVKSNSGCTASTTASVIVSPYPNSPDDQTATGTNTWIGHMYSGMNFNNYIGHFTETETFDEDFGGDYNCFTVSSGATYPSIYTEQFSVRFRMNSSRDGLYVADLGSDDGSRLYVDATLIYNNWADQSFSTRSSVLMNLTGSTSLVYEFYENAIDNRVIFNNLKLILANNLASNTTQSICKGNTGAAISGDVFGTLPSGISLSGTGYQWTYSTTPTGARTNIPGATSATYSPNTSVAPFNVAGTYYIYRNAKLSSTNNTGVSPYVATNESNAATITVTPVSVGGAVSSSATVCSGTNSGTLNLTGNAGSVIRWEYSTNGGSTWTTIANTATSQTYSNITLTTQYRAVVQSGVCTSANSSSATITVNPVSVGGAVSSSATVCSGTNSGTLNLTGNTGSVIRWEYSTNGGSTWTTIANTATSQTYSNITLTTQYRAVVQSGVCTSANSSSATITVNPVSVGGAVSSSATVCSGINSGTLNLTGNTGSVIRWEYSTNGGSTWTTLANTTTSQTYSNITQTTQYRATVQSGVCTSTNSTAATITVNPVPSATISYPGSPFCTGGGTGAVTRTGAAGGTFSSTTGLSINSSTGAININSSTAGNYIITYSVAAGVCAAYSTTTNISITAPGSWSGAVSSDWNDNRNWLCGQIPTSAINVTIPNGASYYPTVTSGLVYANNINIQSGGTITISGGTLQIFGTITNLGIFDVSNGTIEMHGTSAQTIPALAFKDNNIKNLIISNTNSTGVSLGGILDVYQSLTYGAGGTKLNTGGYLSLKSSASETAWIGNMTGHTINGDVTVERYSEAINNWQFLAIPTNTTQTIHQSWQENQGAGVVGNIGYGTNITGPTGGIGFDFISPNVSMKYWNNPGNAYVGIMNTNVQFPNKTNGFFVYIRGDRRATASGATPHQPTVLRTKGPLYTGSVNFTIPAKSYYSIGNPYASKVDFGNVSGMSAIGSTFYVWDPLIYGSRGLGGYQTLSSAAGFKPLVPTTYYDVSTAYPYLESGQAAFVYNSNAAPVTLTFNETDKATGSHLVFRGADISSSEFFRTYLSTASGKIADGNAVAFNSSYQNRLDAYDAVKISNTGENLGLRRDGVILSIEARSPVTADDTLYFDMKNVARADYQFRFSPQNMQNETLMAFLADNYLKTETEVSLSENTSINFTVNSDAASYAADRFMIVFRGASTLPVTFVSIKAVQKDRNVVVDWHVENESNMQQYQVEKSIDGNHFEQVATTAAKNNGSENYQWIDNNTTSGYNYYRVKSLSKDNNSLYSTVVKVFVADLKSAINIYPNPITDRIIHLQFMNQVKGRYGIRLLNPLGQLVMAKKVEFAGGNGNEDINWNYNLNHGIYQLEVTKPDGNIVVIKVLY